MSSDPFASLINSGKCKHTPGKTTLDVLGGAVHGFLSLFGLGSVGPDPLGDAQSSVNNALKNINSVTAQQSLAAATLQEKDMETLYQNIQDHAKLENIIIQDQTNQLWEAIKEENLFLLILSVLIFMLIFFFLIQKKCC